jgi:phosphatidate cytidylyltransferase
MIKYRLFFGALMTASFAAIMILDGWLGGALLCILITGLLIPAQLELSKLAAAKGVKIFTGVSIVSSVLLGTFYYWTRLLNFTPSTSLPLLLAFELMAVLLYQYLRFGVSNILTNSGATFFSICYLGLLISFVLGIRIDFGLWHTLMFVFVVKFADMGAYAIGSLCGRHKFSPKISPSKTWEGMGGATAIAVIVAIVFAVSCGIMALWLAVIFGVCFAFIGQLGDLVESMLKRDSVQKDSANKVPGFGGILDIIDSPLLAAPFAYLFFMCSR